MLSQNQKNFLMGHFVLPAFKYCGRQAWAAGEPWEPSPTAFETWRHAQVQAAVGKPGLRQCDNDDFCPLCAHFCDLMGQPDKALEWLLKANTDRRRRIEKRLTDAMFAGGFGTGYVQHICHDQFHCSVEDATDDQLVHLCRTLTARAKGRDVSPGQPGRDVSPKRPPSEPINAAPPNGSLHGRFGETSLPEKAVGEIVPSGGS